MARRWAPSLCHPQSPRQTQRPDRPIARLHRDDGPDNLHMNAVRQKEKRRHTTRRIRGWDSRNSQSGPAARGFLPSNPEKQADRWHRGNWQEISTHIRRPCYVRSFAKLFVSHGWREPWEERRRAYNPLSYNILGLIISRTSQ